MQVQNIQTQNHKTSFAGFMNNRALIKGLEMASDNGALFCSGTALILSTFVRPFAILATPKTDKENKQYACAKSIASSIVNFGLMALITTPVVSAVKNVQEKPKQFLTKQAIKTFKDGEKNLAKSHAFSFATQFFKLGSGLLTVIPKTFLTCALIPPVVSFFFKKENEQKTQNKQISFKGATLKPTLYEEIIGKISNIFGKILNSKKMQNFSQKYKDTNLAQHMFSASDILATGLFINYTSKNKNIKKSNQKSLIYNAAISTGLTIIGGYAINELLRKPTQIFIDNFKKANANLPTLDKCIDGIKNAKAALILGGMYYLLTPMLATFLAGTMTKTEKEE